MCVCASIRPRAPVYFERSMVSAPDGMAEASVVTVRIFPPSITTVALDHTFPLASHNLPKRTALIGVFGAGFSCANADADASANDTIIEAHDLVTPDNRIR